MSSANTPINLAVLLNQILSFLADYPNGDINALLESYGLYVDDVGSFEATEFFVDWYTDDDTRQISKSFVGGISQYQGVVEVTHIIRRHINQLPHQIDIEYSLDDVGKFEFRVTGNFSSIQSQHEAVQSIITRIIHAQEQS